VLDLISSMEEAHSSTWRHISNLAKLAHSRLNPCSQSQLKLPLFLEVAREPAFSGVPSSSPSDLDSSEVLAPELPAPSPLDSSEESAHELPVPSPLDESGVRARKSRQSAMGRAVGPGAIKCSCMG